MKNITEIGGKSKRWKKKEARKSGRAEKKDKMMNDE
jgi:hypothetical protein